MSLHATCQQLDVLNLRIGARVVCFYPEDDFPHFGVVSHLPFEMPDGVTYFAIDDDLQGPTLFPVIGGRCYCAPFIKVDSVAKPLPMGACVCINSKRWGFLSGVSVYERACADGMVLELAGIRLFRKWFNGSLESNWDNLGNEDIKTSTEFIAIEAIEQIHLVEGLYCNKNNCAITPRAYVSINQGEYFGQLDAILFPDSPLAEVLNVNTAFLLILTSEFGKTEVLSSDVCKTLNRRFFGQYADTCDTIKCNDTVKVCYLSETFTETTLQGVVEQIIFPRTSEAQAHNVYFSGGIVLRDENLKTAFVQWHDYLKIVQCKAHNG